MMRKLSLYIALAFPALLFAQPELKLDQDFSNADLNLPTMGRGICKIENGVLRSKDAFALFGDESWRNYEFSFRARTPKTEKEVQIWAGFRAHNRFDRYVVGLKGGNQDDLYLSRMGYMGSDELLAYCDLGFHPVPGVWYDIKIKLAEGRIQIFLNNEDIPHIDVVDKNSALAPSGPVTLGGAWLTAEFDDLKVRGITAETLGFDAPLVYSKHISAQQKEAKRVGQRSEYSPARIESLSGQRTTVSLDGKWLFMPDYQLSDKEKAVSALVRDEEWHVMDVPEFWNPSRIWLHGETFGSQRFAKGTSDTYFQMETRRCENYTFDYHRPAYAWYRHWVEMPKAVQGKNVEIVFDAISKVSEIYVNGTMAGSNVGMFGEIRVNASALIKPGANLITVKVIKDYLRNIDDPDKVIDVAVTIPVTNSMIKDIAHGFYCDSPAGIWQPVKMVITDPLKVDDVFIIPSLTGAKFEVTVKNNGNTRRTFRVKTTITDKKTGETLYDATMSSTVTIAPGTESVVEYSTESLKPKLWSPQHPNLYDFKFTVLENSKPVDVFIQTSGFRTFETKDGYFYLNGVRYWLRGANHTGFYLAPNDREYADKFFSLMKAANIEVTRTHTTPYNELWMEAADQNGIGVSFEGTWPWLMIHSTMPDRKLIDLWSTEFLGLIKKYRNHPSLLFWTVNNEMKFYDNEPDFEVAKKKMGIISDVVKQMRAIDPTRPVSFDSNYRRNTNKFGDKFFDNIDDGDIDDVHGYYNWYNHSMFNFFKGEFQHRYLNANRPLISQEMATGYPNSETGHATRMYNLVHHTPQSLIGYNSYEYGDPDMFLDTQGFLTGEMAEAFRRSGDKSAGMIHFALVTWFRNVYDKNKIEAYPAYYAIKRALSPILVSAELWGRNFYAGDDLPARVCIVNDLEDGSALPASTLDWWIADNSGKRVASGSENIERVEHYTRRWIEPRINIPTNLVANNDMYSLNLELSSGGCQISANEYKIRIARRDWVQMPEAGQPAIVVVDYNDISSVLSLMKVKYKAESDLSKALEAKAGIYIISGLEPGKNCMEEQLTALRRKVASGARVLLLNSPSAAQVLYPEYITGSFLPSEGDIVNLEIPESPVFDQIGTLDLRYFNNCKSEIPTVCNSVLSVNRNDHVIPLASHIKIHGYVSGEMQERSQFVSRIKGFTIVRVEDGGVMFLSTMAHEKGDTDPVAARLLLNMINAD